MNSCRQSGILLHITSLPSNYGIGDIGNESYRFVDFLSDCKQRLWQMLPIGTIGLGDSPYQSFSAFAGNPLLISMDLLVEEGLLKPHDLIPMAKENKVNFPRVKANKSNMLNRAYRSFKPTKNKAPYEQFVYDNKWWLEDYSLFMSARDYFHKLPWNHWENSIRSRNRKTLDLYREILKESIEYNNFVQFKFFEQWDRLKYYSNSKGIKLIGDMPIFVSHDSSDVWQEPYNYKLDNDGNPKKVAGVPPDYFSETGQLWGNPVYDWERLRESGYRWWMDRFRFLGGLFDTIRIDHFRGFEAVWEVPFGEKTAEKGSWIEGPGWDIFQKLYGELGSIQGIAEDLGTITPKVIELKDKCKFPGMLVMQFAFEGEQEHEILPNKHSKDLVVYTGTHDNDTIIGWYKKHEESSSRVIELLNKYFGITTGMDNRELSEELIKITMSSNGDTAVIPLQDILALDSSGRMNKPGTAFGNWDWRFNWDEVDGERVMLLQDITLNYKRA